MLAGTSAIDPKTGDGVGETSRSLATPARKGRTTAIITRKAMIVNAPAELCESLATMPDKALLDRCGGFRPGPVQDTTASTKHTLRALAKRWVDLDTEITGHDRLHDTLTAHAAPTLARRVCQRPAGSARGRSVDLPAGGQQFCPLAASSSARFSWSGASPPCRRWLE